MSSEDSAEPLIRVMALNALAYCERLFYPVPLWYTPGAAQARLFRELAGVDDAERRGCELARYQPR